MLSSIINKPCYILTYCSRTFIKETKYEKKKKKNHTKQKHQLFIYDFKKHFVLKLISCLNTKHLSHHNYITKSLDKLLSNHIDTKKKFFKLENKI